MLTFIDYYLRKVWVYTLETKDPSFVTFNWWKAMVEKQKVRKVKKLRTYDGKEYRSAEFENYFKDNYIVRHCSTIGIAQQNGVAERLNRTVLERAYCMLLTVALFKDF